MKVATAARERPDSRASPQTPCPEVQPDPSAVPVPTSSPAAIISPRFVGTVCTTAPPRARIASGAAISPSTKAIRQSRSRAAPGRASAPWVMPAMPAIFPNRPITITALIPIRMPPPSEAQGVKVVSVSMSACPVSGDCAVGASAKLYIQFL